MTDIRSSQDVSIKDDDSGAYVEVDSRDTNSKGLNTLDMGEYRSSGFTLTNGQVAPLQLTTEGKLKVDVTAWSDSNKVKVWDGSKTATVDTYGTTGVGIDILGRGVYLSSPPTLTNGQTHALQLTSAGKLKVDTGGQADTPTYMIIRDAETSTYQAQVNSAGRILVAIEPPVPPAGTTGVIQTEYDAVTGSMDNIYIIPNAQTLYIQRFAGGSEFDNANGSVDELWYDPLGTGVGMTIIATLFVNGISNQMDLNSSYVGNGTRAIRMRRRRFGGGSKLIFARWEGYY